MVFTVTRPDFDLPGHVKRELSQVEWRLNNLRFNADTFNTELERDLKMYIARRQKKMEEHEIIVGNLGIPVRQSAAIPSAFPHVPPRRTYPQASGSGEEMGCVHFPCKRG